MARGRRSQIHASSGHPLASAPPLVAYLLAGCLPLAGGAIVQLLLYSINGRPLVCRNQLFLVVAQGASAGEGRHAGTAPTKTRPD